MCDLHTCIYVTWRIIFSIWLKGNLEEIVDIFCQKKNIIEIFVQIIIDIFLFHKIFVKSI